MENEYQVILVRSISGRQVPVVSRSGQKFIARQRAPRVSIEYAVEALGLTQRRQLPFVIGVFADLAGKPILNPPSLRERPMLEIDVDNFDARLCQLRPRAVLSVPDTIRGEGELAVDLTFESLDDFLPASVARRTPGLDKLLQARRQLADLTAYMDGKAGAEDLIERVLNDKQLQKELASGLGSSSDLPDQPPGQLPDQPSDQPPNQPLEPVDTDSLSALLQREFRPKTQQAVVQLWSAVQTLAEQARADRGSIGDAAQSIHAIIATLDHQLEQQINLILHHPDFRQLEGAWRGLHYLVSNTETSEMLKIRFMSLSRAELDKVIRRYQGSWDQSPLFKKIYEEEYGTVGGEPYGCLIGDYEFTHSPKDMEVLRGVAQIAATAHVPFLAAGSPGLMQVDTWQQVATPRDISALFAGPDYVPWRALRESDDSRYVALTMPRCLARLPYGAQTNPVEEFAFEEPVRGADANCFVWMNSAYALATNIGRAFSLYGWCARIRGLESGGLVENLPYYEFPSEEGGIDSSPTEISISDRWEAELSRTGLMPLVKLKNTGRAAFIGAQSLHQPAVYDDPDATAGAALAARLPYLLPSCRFVHYLKCIARDAVGSFASREDLEWRLSEWILQYVHHDPTSLGENGKARFPLADAQIVLEPIEGNPASYRAILYIRPHYQLEGLTVSQRLVLKLP
jgi:type VI secretion system protein ImpC